MPTKSGVYDVRLTDGGKVQIFFWRTLSGEMIPLWPSDNISEWKEKPPKS